MVSYEQIEKANNEMTAIDIKGTPYMAVNQRIKAFRKVFPDGFIINELLSNNGGVCVVRSEVGYYTENGEKVVLGTGMAYEKEGSTFINKTSYLENCESSACGRALGMLGFGIDASVASAEEVQNAMANQEPKQEQPKQDNQKAAPKATPKQIEILKEIYKDKDKMAYLLKANGIKTLEEMSMAKASDLISKGGKK